VNTVPLSAFTARDWLLQGPGTWQTGVGDDPLCTAWVGTHGNVMSCLTVVLSGGIFVVSEKERQVQQTMHY